MPAEKSILDMARPFCLYRVISGGQIGADQAGLEAAKAVGLETGGTAPATYRTQNGSDLNLQDVYGLKEDPSYDYKPRTIKNVVDSDATIIIAKNINSPGCSLTARIARQKRKPLLVIPVKDAELQGLALRKAIDSVVQFIQTNMVTTVNIAGNRDHTNPRYPLGDICKSILIPAFSICKGHSHD